MLIVLTERSGESVTVHCQGRLLAGAHVWDLYNAVISEQNPRAVVLDLTGVNRVDAGGLGVLVVLSQWATGSGVRLQLIPSEPVKELLELTRLHTLFEIRSPETMPSPGDLLGGFDDTIESRCA
jgi:anti-anti-sigma factor